MKVVYAIVCHKLTNPLIHTVKYLSSFEENIILIHVDKKSEIKDFLVLKNNNVHLIPNRIDVTWGALSLTRATLELMDFSLHFQYDFFFLLSGDDIPLKNNSELKELLNTFHDYNFISYAKEATVEHIENRIKYLHPDEFFQRDARLLTRVKKKAFALTRDIFYKNKSFEENRHRLPPLYKGSNWFGLTADTIKYILDYISDNEWFLKVFDKSFASDETVFHTIIKTNPKLKIFEHTDYPRSCLRYIDWQSGPDYPKVLGEEDRLKIKASKCSFARKISEDASPEFMEYFLKK